MWGGLLAYFDAFFFFFGLEMVVYLDLERWTRGNNLGVLDVRTCDLCCGCLMVSSCLIWEKLVFIVIFGHFWLNFSLLWSTLCIRRSRRAALVFFVFDFVLILYGWMNSRVLCLYVNCCDARGLLMLLLFSLLQLGMVLYLDLARWARVNYLGIRCVKIFLRWFCVIFFEELLFMELFLTILIEVFFVDLICVWGADALSLSSLYFFVVVSLPVFFSMNEWGLGFCICLWNVLWMVVICWGGQGLLAWRLDG